MGRAGPSLTKPGRTDRAGLGRVGSKRYGLVGPGRSGRAQPSRANNVKLWFFPMQSLLQLTHYDAVFYFKVGFSSESVIY